LKKKLAEMTYILNERNIRSHFIPYIVDWVRMTFIFYGLGPQFCDIHDMDVNDVNPYININCIPNSILINTNLTV
jgi:hypothetical protein